MKAESLVNLINSDFYAGVPDSQLKALCNYLMKKYGVNSTHHIIAANEGNCTALATGYYLSTGKIPVVYMQNSGEGNIINPVVSLLNNKVYGIPCIFIVGWRGEPGLHDEPQHLFQGEITIRLLNDMDILTFIIGEETSEEDVAGQLKQWQESLKAGKQVAFIIKKNALSDDNEIEYKNGFSMCREEVIRHITDVSQSDIIVSTTGKASRELFEIREKKHQSHSHDFLTVGSMGHSSSIAMEIAIQKPEKRIWCLDGDGAVLMHMGAMAVIGAYQPANLVHIVINNEAHETVGGMPTVMSKLDLTAVARGCGYAYVERVSDYNTLDEELKKVKEQKKLSLLEIRCAIGSRKDLGRPTTTPMDNRNIFMQQVMKQD